MRSLLSIGLVAALAVPLAACSSDGRSDFDASTPDMAGEQWIAQDVPNVDYFAVHGSSATDVLLVGKGGTIVRWNGTAFITEQSGTTADLFGVHAVNPMLAYAVGAAGTTVVWNGTQWTASNFSPNPDAGLPPTPALSSVWADTTQAIAVGEQGTAVKYDGTTWAQVLTDSPDNLLSVVNSGEIFAVGTLGTVSTLIGNTFVRLPLPGYSKTLSGAVSDPGGNFIVGIDGALFSYNGSWNLIPGLPAVFLRSVAAPAGGDVWVVGFDGAVARVRGGGSDIFVYPNIPQKWLYGVWAAAADDVWIAGASGLVLRGPPPNDPPISDGGTNG